MNVQLTLNVVTFNMEFIGIGHIYLLRDLYVLMDAVDIYKNIETLPDVVVLRM